MEVGMKRSEKTDHSSRTGKSATSGKVRKWLILFCALFCLCLLGLVAYRGGKKEMDYQRARQSLAAGSVNEAYGLFKQLRNYKDVGEQMRAMEEADPMIAYRNAEKGARVFYGHYEQDNDKSDGKEPVEWIVLDRLEDRILLLSAEALDCHVYHEIPFEPITWAESGIRHWLNGEFFEEIFTQEEQGYIALTENRNPDHSTLETNGGEDTVDRVFLLSEMEAGIYLGDEMARFYTGVARATDFCIARGAVTDDNGNCEWWLRTPGGYEYAAQFVDMNGSIYDAGAYVDLAYGVRPAVWLMVGER